MKYTAFLQRIYCKFAVYFIFIVYDNIPNICSHSTTILLYITKASSKFMHLNG